MIVNSTCLLAKTPKNTRDVQHPETLYGHTQMTCQMANCLTDLLGGEIQEKVGCTAQEMSFWKEAVWLGAWMHDWGKANDHFQKALSQKDFRQGVRHETISLIIINELSTWLKFIWTGLPEWARCGAIFAAGGHHLKRPDPLAEERPGKKVLVYMSHPDFAKTLRIGIEKYEMSVPNSRLEDCEYHLHEFGDLENILRNMQREMDLEFTDKEKSLIAAVKSTVMSSDLAGSALPFKKNNPEGWLRDRLGKTLNTTELRNVAGDKLKGCPLHRFQEEIMRSNSKTVLLEAGCGCGKTAAAYLWASRQADGKRLFVCYPTTGTASEGFAGYLHDPDFEAILIHSRSQADYRLMENMPSPSDEENDLRAARLEALETWPAPVSVCTAHTVLGLLENVRRGLYAWPSLARAAFVFDEIHAYSDTLFSYLLTFLKAFPGAPVLLMTATLPFARKNALQWLSKTKRGGIEFFKGPEIRERAKRYTITEATEDYAWEQAEKVLEKGGKVLWITNTVARAMERAKKAKDEDIGVKPYHSRYRYCDRLRRQRELIDGFGAQESMLAVCTQVAEMSLDLSADLLVTEKAPVAAMIQRLGRLNRYAAEPEQPKSAIVIKPPDILPYGEEELSSAEIWLKEIADGASKSQKELAAAFQMISEETKDNIPLAKCEWLDGLWKNQKDQRTIEEAGHTIEIIREEDETNGELVENAIPMPFPYFLPWKTWHWHGRYLVAPVGTINYDAFRGAEWNRP